MSVLRPCAASGHVIRLGVYSIIEVKKEGECLAEEKKARSWSRQDACGCLSEWGD